MTTTTDTSVTDTGVPRLHQGDAPGHLGGDHEPRLDRAIRLRGPGGVRAAAGGKYVGYTSEAMRTVGSPDIAIDGEVIEADPPHKLVQTWRMVMDPELESEGFTRLTFEIAEGQGGVSKLTVTHELDGAPKLSVLMSGGMEDVAPAAAGHGCSATSSPCSRRAPRWIRRTD